MKIRLKLWVKILLTIIVLFSLFTLYSRYIGTNGLKVKEYSIVNSKIPESFYGIKIVHISDIHYKVTTTKEELEEGTTKAAEAVVEILKNGVDVAMNKFN